MFLVKLSLWCRDPGDNGHSSKKTLKEREILSILRIEERHINFYLVRYAASDMFSTRKLVHPVWLNSNRPEACFEWVGVAVTWKPHTDSASLLWPNLAQYRGLQ